MLSSPPSEVMGPMPGEVRKRVVATDGETSADNADGVEPGKGGQRVVVVNMEATPDHSEGAERVEACQRSVPLDNKVAINSGIT